MSETVNAPPAWDAFRATVLREPLICFGMTVREATLDDAGAIAGLLDGPPPARGGRDPRPVGNDRLARHMIHAGSVMVVDDDERRPMGLVSLRNAHLGRAGAGWRLDERRLGKGLSAILLEGVTERLFRAGIPVVQFRVPAASRAARRTLETLGFACVNANARPLLYEADAAMFAARSRRGTDLLPTPAERRRGPSPGEQGLVEETRDPRHLAADALRRAFPAVVSGEGVTLERASRVGPAGLVDLVPDPPGADAADPERKLSSIRAANLDHLLVAADADGDRYGTLTTRPLPDGGVELGWFVKPGRRGEGLATLMAAFASDRLFSAGFERITCAMDRDNAASRRVAERVGFAAAGPETGGGLAMALAAADLRRPSTRDAAMPGLR